MANKQEKEKPLFDSLEDCQSAIALLTRRDALDAVRAMDIDQAKRLLDAFSRICDTVHERIPMSKKLALIQTRFPNEDRLINIHEAALMLGFSPKWIYRHHHELTFTRRTKSGRLRFSVRGLQAFLNVQTM